MKLNVSSKIVVCAAIVMAGSLASAYNNPWCLFKIKGPFKVGKMVLPEDTVDLTFGPDDEDDEVFRISFGTRNTSLDAKAEKEGPYTYSLRQGQVREWGERVTDKIRGTVIKFDAANSRFFVDGVQHPMKISDLSRKDCLEGPR